jgi:hypothetical protein
MPPRTTLLISVSGTDTVRDPQNPQMQRRERLVATPHGPTDQGYEAWPSTGSNRRSRSPESGTMRARASEPFLEPTGSRVPHMSCLRASEGS